MAEIGDLSVKLSIDSARFEQSLSSIDRNLKAMGQEIRGVQNKGKDWGNSIQGLTTKQSALTRMLDGQGTKVERLRAAYEKSKAETGENSAETERLAVQLNRAQAEYNRTETELKQVSAALKAQQDALRVSESNWTKLGESLTEFGNKMKKVGEDVKDVGKTLSVKMTAPLVALGTLATKSAIDFESAFAGVKKAVDETDAEFAELEKGIRSMAKEIPASASAISEVAETAGQLGIEKESILGFTRTMVDLGEATNLTSDQAATSFARFANIVGMSHSDFDKLGSSVVALGNNMATTESEIVEMSMRLAGVGKQVGFTESDIMALSASMSSVGIAAEAGGSAMTTVIKKISNAVSSGGKDMDNFAKVSKMSSEEFSAAWKSDPIQALDAFIKGLSESGQSGENLNKILGDLGIKGINESDALLRLAGASDILTEAIGISSTAWTENTALTDEAAQRYETTASQLAIFKNTLVDLGITLGSIIIPYMMQIVEAVQPWIEKFAELDESTHAIMLAIAALAAAIGPVLVVLGTLISSVGTIISAFGALSSAVASAGGVLALLSNPIGLAVAAIGTIVTALVIAYNNMEWFRDGVNLAWEKIKEVIMTVVEATTSFIVEAWSYVTDWYTENQELIRQTTEMVWNLIQSAIEVVMTFLVPYLTTMWENIRLAVEVVWEAIKTHVMVTLDLITGIIKAAMQIIDGDWKGAWNTIKDTFESIWSRMQKFVETVTDKIRTVIKNQFERVRDLVQTTLTATKTILTTLFTEMVTIVITKATEIVESIKDKFEAVKTAIKTKLTEAVTMVGEKISEMVGKVTEKATEFYNAGENIVKSIASGITDSVRFVTDAIGMVTQKIRDFLPFSPAKEGALKDIMNVKIAESIAESIDKGRSKAIQSMNRLTRDLSGRIHSSDFGLYSLPVGSGVVGGASRGRNAQSLNSQNGLNSGDGRIISVLQEQNFLLHRILNKKNKSIMEMDSREVGRLVTDHVGRNMALKW